MEDDFFDGLLYDDDIDALLYGERDYEIVNKRRHRAKVNRAKMNVQLEKGIIDRESREVADEFFESPNRVQPRTNQPKRNGTMRTINELSNIVITALDNLTTVQVALLGSSKPYTYLANRSLAAQLKERRTRFAGSMVVVPGGSDLVVAEVLTVDREPVLDDRITYKPIICLVPEEAFDAADSIIAGIDRGAEHLRTVERNRIRESVMSEIGATVDEIRSIAGNSQYVDDAEVIDEDDK